MTTRQTMENYLEPRAGADWRTWLDDDVIFTSWTVPATVVRGKPAVVQVFERLYSMKTEFKVNSSSSKAIGDCDDALPTAATR